MKVLSLVGARPQIIKEAVLGEKLRDYGFKEIIVHSGQHYDYEMSEVFFDVLNIKKPCYNLGVGSGLHGEMTGRIMIEFEKLVLKEKPDFVIVYGDTNTTVAGALVCAKLKVPVVHVEAGIRQKPKDMPEEINRVVTDHVSDILFAPSELAVKNLRSEGINEGVYFTGDVMYDLFLKMRPYFDFSVLKKFDLSENAYTVVTIHRDFNTDDKSRLEDILKSLVKISSYERVIFPMHPRTRKRIKEFSLEYLLKDLTVVRPLDYLKMMGLVVKASRIITDSGGLQKEAYFSGKRCVVVMPDTGWKELIELNWNVLSEPKDIFNNWERLFDDADYESGIYGCGDAVDKMVLILCKKGGR